MAMINPEDNLEPNQNTSVNTIEPSWKHTIIFGFCLLGIFILGWMVFGLLITTPSVSELNLLYPLVIVYFVFGWVFAFKFLLNKRIKSFSVVTTDPEGRQIAESWKMVFTVYWWWYWRFIIFKLGGIFILLKLIPMILFNFQVIHDITEVLAFFYGWFIYFFFINKVLSKRFHNFVVSINRIDLKN